MRLRFVGLSLAAQLLFGFEPPAWGQSPVQDGWENLFHVTHNRSYFFQERGANCFKGRILQVTNQSVTVEIQWASQKGQAEPKTRILNRDSLLYLGESSRQTSFIYSGRSSWSDLKNLHIVIPAESLLVVTKDNRRHEGKWLETLDGSIKLRRGSRTIEIAKANISQVYFVRVAPVSEGDEYWGQEGFGYLDPKLWPYYLRIPPKIKVLLFAASQPEDDSPAPCIGR